MTPRSKTGQAISPTRKTPQELSQLRTLLQEAHDRSDLDTWRRARAVLSYIEGVSVIQIAEQLSVARGSINQWLRWFETIGTDGLRPRKAPGAAPRLSLEQRSQLVELIESGPQSCGFTSGLWTGPMIGDLIFERFQVRYHHQHVPRLLHQLGFSVQRPRKRLARADLEAQNTWVRERFPDIKKKPQPAGAS